MSGSVVFYVHTFYQRTPVGTFCACGGGGVWWWMHHSWRGVLCLVLGLVRMCVVMRWRVWWLVSRPRRWLGMWGTGVGR